MTNDTNSILTPLHGLALICFQYMPFAAMCPLRVCKDLLKCIDHNAPLREHPAFRYPGHR